MSKSWQKARWRCKPPELSLKPHDRESPEDEAAGFERIRNPAYRRYDESCDRLVCRASPYPQT